MALHTSACPCWQVPTEWHRDVFQRLLQSVGVPSPSVAVIPESVDTTLFDPGNHLGRNRTTMSSSPQRSPFPVLNSTILGLYMYPYNDCDCSSADNGGCRRPPFTFLSIFKWEERKGWDTLLESYWKAFSPTDHVLLRLRLCCTRFLLSSSVPHALINSFWFVQNICTELWIQAFFRSKPRRCRRPDKGLRDEAVWEVTRKPGPGRVGPSLCWE